MEECGCGRRKMKRGEGIDYCWKCPFSAKSGPIAVILNKFSGERCGRISTHDKALNETVRD